MELILVASAVIPAVWLMIRVYRADRLEKEPAGLLTSLIFLGILSTSLAALTEELGVNMLNSLFQEENLLYDAILYFAVVALSEEGFKYLLLKIRTWKSPHFNCTFDGVVYAVFVSLGFALWENISYVLRYGMGTALARAITAIPGHACFGVFMGVWYGVAKRYELADLPEEANRARWSGFVSAVILHGLYDFIATIQNEYMGIVFLIFVGWMFRKALQLVKQASAEDSPVARSRNNNDF